MRIWIAVIGLTLSGCPEAKKGGTSPPAACTKMGAQCELASGGLGVCTDAPCPEGKPAPCLKCMSQH